jgi:hypothetical protein
MTNGSFDRDEEFFSENKWLLFLRLPDLVVDELDLSGREGATREVSEFAEARITGRFTRPTWCTAGPDGGLFLGVFISCVA